jgi:hypothetical protein
MCATEHCAQREESLHAVKTDNVQLPVFKSTEGNIEKWALTFTFANDGYARDWQKSGEIMDCEMGPVQL